MASKATAGPGNDGAVYVYCPFPDDEDLDIEVHDAMTKVSSEILHSSGVFIARMYDVE